jgi:hypothetical protein
MKYKIDRCHKLNIQIDQAESGLVGLTDRLQYFRMKYVIRGVDWIHLAQDRDRWRAVCAR